MTLLESKKKNLANLWQNKKLSDRELTAKTEMVINAVDSKIDIDKLFTEKKEKKLAKELLRKYLKDYIMETVSDRNILSQLIYLEVMQFRFQKDANKFHKESKAMPAVLVNQIHENIRMIVDLKKLLDDTSGKKDDETKVLTKLKRKYKIWLKENQLHRTMVCPYCGKMVLLKIKTDCYDAVKHPFFRDRVLTNEHLMFMYLNNKITKLDVAKTLGTSEDYVDWLISKYSYKKETNGLPKPEEQSNIQKENGNNLPE